MLWQVYVFPLPSQPDLEGRRVASEIDDLGTGRAGQVHFARGYLIDGELRRPEVERIARELLADPVIEAFALNDEMPTGPPRPGIIANVLLKPGVMDPVAQSVGQAILQLGLKVNEIHTFRRYWIDGVAEIGRKQEIADCVLANDAIELVTWGPLKLDHFAHGSAYRLEVIRVPIRTMTDLELERVSRLGQLSLSLVEMQTIQRHFREIGRDPTDAELETLAQTWSEHCSHKTLRGRIDYEEIDENGQVTRREHFENLLKETIFKATQDIRKAWGPEKDWCVSVFEDNAGVVRFDENYNVCFKVETHNHPSAIEPYGGANTGLGGVVRDTMGTGLGAKPIANTDIFCFAPPDFPAGQLPPGVLHPKRVMRGVVAGVRDYGNRMGIPTVNGAIYFDDRYLGNPLVFCGSVGLIPRDRSKKEPKPGDLIVAVGGRTGRDGIHGATFSSIELTHESDELSGGAVQIGNAITEKMMLDVLLQARDRGLYDAITDCGAGGFSSAVGEMGADIGAEVWLEKVPLKYAGLSYTEIWISEAQERMVLAAPESNWPEFERLARSEGVEATVIGRFDPTGRLVLKYEGHVVGDLNMKFLHDGRPPVVRKALFRVQGSGFRKEEAGEPGRKGAGDSPQADTSPSIVPAAPLPTVVLESPVTVRSVCEATGVSAKDILRKLMALNMYVDINKDLDESTIRRIGEELGVHLKIESGLPVSPSRSLPLSPSSSEPPYNEPLRRILSSWNVCSKEWVIRQYDHEVQGGSVIKPLVGAANDGPSDAAVIRPVLNSYRGLAIACGMNPRYGDLDPYWMAASAIDEAIRNCVAVGADPDRIAILDNFCWGNTDRPEELGKLVRAALACRDVATAYGTPFISGKDSLNNEFKLKVEFGGVRADGQVSNLNAQISDDHRIVIPPTLLISAIGQIDDVRKCVTMDLKAPGNTLWLIGEFPADLGGSHFNLVNDRRLGLPPRVDARFGRFAFRLVYEAIRCGMVRSCHDVSEGGVAVAVAEMAVAGGLGASFGITTPCTELEVELPEGEEPDVRTEVECKLFAEGNSRFVLEIPEDLEEDFDRLAKDLWRYDRWGGNGDGHNIPPIGAIGDVEEEPVFEVHEYGPQFDMLRHRKFVSIRLSDLKECWQRPLRW